MTNKKLLILAFVTAFILMSVAVVTFYSFNQRALKVDTHYQSLLDHKSQTEPNDHTQCLPSELVNNSFVAIDTLYRHPLQSVLTSDETRSNVHNSVNILINYGVDCLLAYEEKRFITQTTSRTTNKNLLFTDSATQLTEFIQAFITFEATVENRQQLIKREDLSLNLTVLNKILNALYDYTIDFSVNKNIALSANTPSPYKADDAFITSIEGHLRTLLNAIDIQLEQQLFSGTLWVEKIQQGTVSSADIGRLSQWIYWLDNLPTQCDNMVASLTPLLKTVSTSPLLLANNSTGHLSFSITQQAINDCPSLAKKTLASTNTSWIDEPLLLDVRGVSFGLVSPGWLTIAASLEQLSSLPFMAHSVLIEKTPTDFTCRKTTTEWDDHTATLMAKYTREAIDFLEKNNNTNIDNKIVANKVAALVNALANTAQKNLSITPSTSIKVNFNNTAQISGSFTQFFPHFVTAMENVKSLKIDSSLIDLQNCVSDYATTQLSRLSSLKEESQLFTPPTIDVSNSSPEKNENKFLAFSSQDDFEKWWEDQRQRTLILLEQSTPYITFILNASNNRSTARNTFEKWRNTQQEITDHQKTDGDNQVSRLYFIYKKTALMTRLQCDNFLEDNVESLNNFGNYFYYQSRREHIQRINRFCG
jgi:hypothetical protein